MIVKNEQITLDGPAASGKSSAAKCLAKHLNAFYINTGDMYRALTYLALEAGIDAKEEAGKVIELLAKYEVIYKLVNEEPVLHIDGKPADLAKVRAPEVTAQVSFVAKVPAVRDWMLARQRETVSLGLIVMEGRDIGTVVFPEAKYKFFVTASPLVRAQRRLDQSGEVAEGMTVEDVAADIAKRDEIDMNREIAPLRPAEDAVLVDSSDKSLDEVVDLLKAHCQGLA